MNNGIDELALLLCGYKNPPPYKPVFGTIEELPQLKIKLGAKITLTSRHIKSIVDLYKTNSDGEYIYLHKTAAMLPYDGNNQYLVLGVVFDG